MVKVNPSLPPRGGNVRLLLTVALRLPCRTPFPEHAYSQTRTCMFTITDMHIHERGHAYSRMQICVFAHTDMHVHLDACITGNRRGEGRRPADKRSEASGVARRILRPDRTGDRLLNLGDDGRKQKTRAGLTAMSPVGGVPQNF